MTSILSNIIYMLWDPSQVQDDLASDLLIA